jgi:hypothetical protein
MTEDVDELLFDDDNNTAENEEAIETEEDKIKRLRGELEKCLNGSDLYNYCIVHLPITGMKFGVSLSMNRAIAYLKNSKTTRHRHGPIAKKIIKRLYHRSSMNFWKILPHSKF